MNTATGTALLALNYDYYPGGDIRTRSDAVNARLEAFKYDGLDRLTGWSVSSTNGAFATRDTTYAYDLIGNLTNVTVGATTVDTAVYAGPRPHAMTSLNGQTFSYDGRGRQLDGPKRTVTFNAFDLPKQVGDKATGRKAKYLYDADQNRVRKTDLDESITTYIGGVYERRWSKAGIEHVFMVPGEDGPAVQIVYREGGNDTLYHLSNDLHGSVSLVLSDALTVLERRYAEPFGGRVSTDGQPLVSKPSPVTRGFTGHEEERAIGLINMRGRIYDPAQRHFLTPDPLVSDPLFSQSYNRYSYVLNNPLRYTDPSGFTKEATTNSALDPPPAEAGGSWKVKRITQSGRTVEVIWVFVPDAPPAAPAASDDKGKGHADVDHSQEMGKVAIKQDLAQGRAEAAAGPAQHSAGTPGPTTGDRILPTGSEGRDFIRQDIGRDFIRVDSPADMQRAVDDAAAWRPKLLAKPHIAEVITMGFGAAFAMGIGASAGVGIHLDFSGGTNAGGFYGYLGPTIGFGFSAGPEVQALQLVGGETAGDILDGISQSLTVSTPFGTSTESGVFNEDTGVVTPVGGGISSPGEGFWLGYTVGRATRAFIKGPPEFHAGQ